MRKTILACVAAIMIVSATSATAASLITSSQIKDGTIKGRDIAKNTVTSNKLSPGLRRQLAIRQSAASSAPGLAGAAGANGVNGTNGANGKDGAKGAKGDRGQNGQNGQDGQNGAPGQDGAPGQPGQPGSPGAPGAPGQNADGSYTRTVSSFGTGAQDVQDLDTAEAGNSSTIVGDNLRLERGTAGGFARVQIPVTAGTQLSDLESLIYKFNVVNQANDGAAAPTIKFTVGGALACEAPDPCEGRAPFSGGVTTLVYEPLYTNPGIESGTVDTLGAGNKWWSTRSIKGAPNRSTFVSLQSISAANPDMTIGQLTIEAGESGASPNLWAGFVGTVDYLNLGFAGSDATRFDFGS